MAPNRSKSFYAIKECSTCGSWYTKECCSIGNLKDQIIVPVPDSSLHCAVCGTPVDGPYCHGCTRIRMKFEKDLFTYCVDNGVFQNFQDTSESSNDNTNVVNAPREPSVVDPPQIDHNCCYKCGDSLNGIFCQKCICESCGKGAHFGYNCPPKDPIISELEPCYNRNFDCVPHDSQILPQQYLCCENCGGSHETYQCQPMNQEYFNSHSSGFDQFQPPQFSDVDQTPPVTSMKMLHAQTDLIEAMQDFLKKYDHIPHNEKSIKLLLAEEKFLKIKQVVEEEQTQPEYLQELLQNLLKDLQILNEIQPLKQEIPNLIQKDQEEKSTGELLAEERLQKDNQALNEIQSSQEMRIQDLEIQKQQCLEEMKEWMNDLGIREYQKEEIDIGYRRKCEDKIYELKDKFNGLSIEIRKIIQEAEELRESEARARIQKINDDDDNLGFYAVHPNTIHTPVSQNVEPKDSLIMGDGHINTTPETETISVETLVSNPSESDDFSLGECNLFDIDDSYYEKSTSRLAHLAPISPEIVEACVDDDDTDDDYDYDDDFYDCVDFEEDGGEIDLDISKIVDISLREKLVESYLLIEKINAFSLSPPIPISPIFCPSSTIPVVDIDLPLEEANVLSFSDDSMIFPEYESFTFDDEPVMAEVNVFDEINTSELSYPGIGENVVLDEEEDSFTFTTRSFLPFVTYPEVLPASYSTGSEDKIFKPGIFDNDAFKDKSSKELAPSKALLTLDVFDPPHPPLMDFHVTKAFFGFTFSILKIFSKKFVEPGIKNALNSKLNTNSKLLCVKCNGCMVSDNHDLCVLNFINDLNARVKSKSFMKWSKKKVWKPTGKVFTNIGYTWRPTGQTFTIVGNACPLSRITITAKVPFRKPTAPETDTPKPVVTLVYSRKPRKSKTNVSASKPKIVKSISANNKETNKSWGSIVSDVPSSSLDECRLSKLFSVKFGNDHMAKILGYGDYQIGNVTISRVYFVEGLEHNLFSVRQFCDSNHEVAFHQHTCFIRNLKSVDLLTGSQGNNLYTLSLRDMMASSLICLWSKASKTKS
ncbi:hypothetical protein Tco_0718738 [Tanacetum coccineum]